MASQTKVEPVEEASTSAAPNAAGNGGGTPLSGIDDDSEDDQPAQSAMAAAVLMADDEDVSLDELLISDGADDDDDEDDATEVHEGLHRVAMQELGALQTAEATEAPAEPAAEMLPADDADSISVDLEAPSSEAASAILEIHAGEDIPVSEARPSAAAEPSQTNVEPPEVIAPDWDESPEAAAARAAADQEAVAAAAERDRAAKDSDPESSILVSDDAIEPDDTAPSEAISATTETRHTDAAESTPPPLEDDKDDGLVEPESTRADESDGPLPSFDIPEMESSLNGARRPLGVAPELETQAVAPLAPLSEDTEEDDDAVTNIGLPIPETGEYPAAGDSEFAAAGPAAVALSGFDAHAPLDARRAATRIIQRVDPSQLAPGGTPGGFDADRRADTMRPLSGSARPLAVGSWFARLFGRASDVQPPLSAEGGLSASNRRLGWLVDNVLPPLSLIFLGSGFGAGIMLLQQKDAQSGEHDRAVQALEAAAASKRPTTLLERAEAGDGDALFKITNMAPNERTSALTLALEAGSRAQKLNEFNQFSKGLQTPPKELGPLIARVIAYATSPETMLPTFELLSKWTGARGPDVMYAIWEKAGSSRAASLAQELLHSADQRAKATPALAAAVDLRAATTCDDYQAVLPAVIRSGDQRCVAALRTLKHTDGCGDDGKQDCYACLRDNNQLDEALTAVEKRPAPAL